WDQDGFWASRERERPEKWLDGVKYSQKFFDFLRRVVMHQPQSQKAAACLEAQPLAQFHSIHVAVPGVNLLGRKLLGQLLCIPAGMGDGDGRHSLAQPLWIGDAQHLELWP